MAKMRRRLAWMTQGDRYAAELDEHLRAIGEIQRQVAELAETIERLVRDSVDREELRSVADDLAERIGAIADRLDRDG